MPSGTVYVNDIWWKRSRHKALLDSSWVYVHTLLGNALTHVYRSCVATMLHMDCALLRGGGGLNTSLSGYIL